MLVKQDGKHVKQIEIRRQYIIWDFSKLWIGMEAILYSGSFQRSYRVFQFTQLPEAHQANKSAFAFSMSVAKLKAQNFCVQMVRSHHSARKRIDLKCVAALVTRSPGSFERGGSNIELCLSAVCWPGAGQFFIRVETAVTGGFPRLKLIWFPPTQRRRALKLKPKNNLWHFSLVLLYDLESFSINQLFH